MDIMKNVRLMSIMLALGGGILMMDGEKKIVSEYEPGYIMETMEYGGIARKTSAATSEAKVVQKNGKYYYYLDGILQKCGWATINGKTYYFNKSSGAALTGTSKVGSYYYVFAANGVMKHDTYYKDSEGRRFYLKSNGRAATGVYKYTISGQSYISYFNGDGTVVCGRIKKVSDDKWYYFKDSGYAAVGGLYKATNGRYYYADKDGLLYHNGWITIGDKKYYFNKSSAAAVTGTVKIGSYYYVFAANGVMKHDAYYKDSEGRKFYLESNGRAATGVYKYTISGQTYISYFNGDGTVYSGGIKKVSDDKWYYIKDSGYAVVGGLYKASNGKYYYTDENGLLFHNGWLTIGDKKYYFNKSSAAALTGVSKVGSYYYVFMANGVMKTNTYYKDSVGRSFYLLANGRAATGIYSYTVSGNTNISYFNGDGTVFTEGLKKIGEDWYYFKASGYAIKDGLYKAADEKYYYANSDGTLHHNGWEVINGEKYYFDELTALALTGVNKVEDDYYVFSANGTVKHDMYYKDSEGRRFYLLSDGRAAVGLYSYTVSDKKYWSYFNGDGTVFCDGFKEINGKKYYFSEAGNTTASKLFKGPDDNYYYAQEDASLYSGGWKTIDEKVYYFGDDSAAYTGVNCIDDYYYVFNGNGVMKRDCLFVNPDDNKKYYLDDAGKAISGFKEYCNSNGEKRFAYFNGDGTYANQIFMEVDGKLYYFNADGIANTDKVFQVDGCYYYADSEGVVIRTGLTWINGELYNFDSQTGAASTGLTVIDNDYYIFKPNGQARRDQFFNITEDDLRFKLGEDGKAIYGFVLYGDNLRYYKYGGEYAKNGLFTVDGKTYSATADGNIRRDGYRKETIGVDDEGNQIDKYFYFDETTGEAITGIREVEFTGGPRLILFDPDEENGFRTGIQEYDGNKYFFKSNGAAAKGFYSDIETNNLYYCDEKTYYLCEGDDVIFDGVKLPMKEDGSLDYQAAVAIDQDNIGSRVLALGFTQLFKGYTGGVPFGTPLDQITGYACSELVAQLYYNAGLRIGKGDLAPICVEMGFEMKDQVVSSGDIVFWNLTNCTEVLDEVGDPWTIDKDGDGVCDRIHGDNEYGDGHTYHVHHVGIALSNGQTLETVTGKCIMVRDMRAATDTFYPVAYAHWPGDQE